MTFYIEVPPVDNSKPWINIAEFNTEAEAIAFCTNTWSLTDGWYCMLSHDGEHWVVDTPNPNIGNTNNQFLEIEGFQHKSDCLDFAIAAYSASEAGFVCLISEVS